MSFILDALKKSETERQVQNAPGVAHVPHALQRVSQPAWMWALAALLLVNIVVLAGVLLRTGPTPLPSVTAGETVTKPAVRGVDQPVERAAPAVVEPQSVNERERRQPAARRVAAPAPVAQEIPIPVVIEVEEQVSAAADQATANRSVPTVRDGLTTFNELRASGVLQLPDLHLDIHVFSEQPDERFVFVNMSKYKESATLSEGPGVREITPDGVVLEHAGIRFLLPRE